MGDDDLAPAIRANARAEAFAEAATMCRQRAEDYAFVMRLNDCARALQGVAEKLDRKASEAAHA